MKKRLSKVIYEIKSFFGVEPLPTLTPLPPAPVRGTISFAKDADNFIDAMESMVSDANKQSKRKGGK